MKIWKIGIIGTGMIAHFHAQAIESLPNARLGGFWNIRNEKAPEMAKKYGVKSWESTNSMLQSDDIEMVMIATPSGAHMETAIEAAKYGKHVLCEKPLEIKTDRIDRMIEAHEKAGNANRNISFSGFKMEKEKDLEQKTEKAKGAKQKIS